jgi:hypothetical protein
MRRTYPQAFTADIVVCTDRRTSRLSYFENGYCKSPDLYLGG